MSRFSPKLMLQTTLAVLARAVVLLAFSELIFVNEGPVLALVRAENPSAGLLHLAELIAFYMLPAGLLFALENRITGWATGLLVGAFVGWSIEGAVVPAVYEAPPISFFWTSIAWHAPVDVWFGMILLPLLISQKVTARGVILVGLAGLAWGVWSGWTWPELRLSLNEFFILAACSLLLLAIGYWLIALTQRGLSCGTTLRRVLIALNLLAALIWAALSPVFAAFLALLVAANWVNLARAPDGPPLSTRLAPRAVPSLVYLMVFGGTGTLGYSAILALGLPISGPDIAAVAALAGTVFWAAASIAVFTKKRRAE